MVGQPHFGGSPCRCPSRGFVCFPSSGPYSCCETWPGHKRFDDRGWPAFLKLIKKTPKRKEHCQLKSILNWLLRLIVAMVLLCVTAFCTLGFLASFEPGNGWQWKAGYAAAACGSLVGTVGVLRRMRPRILGALALFALTMLCILGFMESYLSLPRQVGYGVLGCCGLTGGVSLLGRGGKRKRPDNGSGLTHGST